MAYIDKIAYNLNRRDEVPNQELAKELAENMDHKGIEEMSRYLFDPNKSIASDCLKVMYEASYIQPSIIVDYYEDFIKLLNSKNNRMVWGAMIAIASIAKVKPNLVYKDVKLIKDKIEKGSVITNVHGVYALINMAAASKEIYSKIIEDIFIILDETRPVDFPKRCETLVSILREEDVKRLVLLIDKHLDALSNAGKKRVEKVKRSVGVI